MEVYRIGFSSGDAASQKLCLRAPADDDETTVLDTLFAFAEEGDLSRRQNAAIEALHDYME